MWISIRKDMDFRPDESNPPHIHILAGASLLGHIYLAVVDSKLSTVTNTLPSYHLFCYSYASFASAQLALLKVAELWFDKLFLLDPVHLKYGHSRRGMAARPVRWQSDLALGYPSARFSLGPELGRRRLIARFRLPAARSLAVTADPRGVQGAKIYRKLPTVRRLLS